MQVLKSGLKISNPHFDSYGSTPIAFPLHRGNNLLGKFYEVYFLNFFMNPQRPIRSFLLCLNALIGLNTYSVVPDPVI